MLNFGSYFERVSAERVKTLEDCFLVTLRRRDQAVRIPRYFTDELAYFLGFFVGDGGLKDTSKTVALTGRREYKIVVGDCSLRFTREIQDVFGRLFGFKPPIRFNRALRGERFFYLDPTFKVVHLFLTTVLGLKEGQYEKYVPPIVFDSSPHIQRWFLRGYFDAEGSVYRKYRRKMWVVSVHAREHSLLVQIQSLLGTAFGVASSRLYREKNASKLFVTRQNEVFKLNRQRLFTHPDKLDKLMPQ
jgi:intein/homing endonuclease